MPTSIFFILLLISVSGALQCDCGFRDPLDPTGALYTTYFETNFTTTSRDQLGQMFRLMQDNVTKFGTARQFQRDNIIIDDEGLHLIVRASAAGQDVPSSELYTNNTNFGFGSYHWLAQTSSVPGTVQAFYMYKSDSNEVDMEYVSKPADQKQTFLYTTKPQLFSPDGAPLQTTLVTYTPPFNMSADLHTYSFVWNSTSIIYSVDTTNWTRPITTNVPSEPGVLAMSHWSDGNPKYSGGPPTEDSTLTIKRVWVFFNSTAAETILPCQNSKQPCTVGEMEPILANTTSAGVNATNTGTGSPHNSSPRVGFASTLLITWILVISCVLF